MALPDRELDAYLALRPRFSAPEGLSHAFRPCWRSGLPLSEAAAAYVLSRVVGQQTTSEEVEVERLRARLDLASVASWLEARVRSSVSYEKTRFPAIGWLVASLGSAVHIDVLGEHIDSLWTAHGDLPLEMLRRNGSAAAIRQLAATFTAAWHRKLGMAALAKLEALATQRNTTLWVLIDGAVEGLAEAPAAVQHWFAGHLEEAMWSEFRFDPSALLRSASADPLIGRWLPALAWRCAEGPISWAQLQSASWARLALPSEVPESATPGAPFDQRMAVLRPFVLDPHNPFSAFLSAAPACTAQELARRLARHGYRQDAAGDGGNVGGATLRVRNYFIHILHETRPVVMAGFREPIAVVGTSVREGDQHRSWIDAPFGLRLLVMTQLANLLLPSSSHG